MKELNRRDYVNYRLEKALETFDAALLLFENSQWNSTINRLYYASFYAVSALLVNEGIEAKSHNGIKTQFFLKYIKTNKLVINFGELYSDLFAWRQQGDYGDFFDFDHKDVEPLMNPTKELIQKIISIINKKK